MIIVVFVITFIIISSFFILFLTSRYKKFPPDKYIIHLRNGKIINQGFGGKIWLLPLIDDCIVIPTTYLYTKFEADIQFASKYFQDFEIIGDIIWKVIDPKKAFNALSWHPYDENNMNHILKRAAETAIRETCINLSFEEIFKNRYEIVQEALIKLNQLTSYWGILIESIEIIKLKIIDDNLSKETDFISKSNYSSKRVKILNLLLIVFLFIYSITIFLLTL